MAVAIASIGDHSESSAAGTTLAVDMPTGIAEGDLLIIHAARRGAGITFTGDSSGGTWTAIQTGNNSDNMTSKASWKLASAGDVAASTRTFDFGGTAGEARAARIFRITGFDSANPIDTSAVATADSATVTVGTVTPSAANHGFLFLVACDEVGTAGKTCSGYTMATDAPSYSEQYDSNFDIGGAEDGMFAAAFAVRTASTATGDNTATLTASDENVGIIVVIKAEVINVTVSPSVVTATATINAPTVSAGSNTSVNVISVTSTINAPTVTTATPKWITENKSNTSPTITNENKS